MKYVDIQNMRGAIFLAVVVIVGIIVLGVCLTPAKEIDTYNLKTKYIKDYVFYFSSYPSTCKNSITNEKIYKRFKLKLTIDIDQFLEDEDLSKVKGKLGTIYKIDIDSKSTFGRSNCSLIDKNDNLTINLKKIENEIRNEYKSPLNSLIDLNDTDSQLFKLVLSKSYCGNYIAELKMKDEFKNIIKK